MCAHFQYQDQCLPSCDVIPGLYKANSTQCMPCHNECESMCSGPGPEHCKLCKHVRDGPMCAPFCPDTKYNSSGECKSCHQNCIKGCHGPENNIGLNGCISCEKAIINGDFVVSILRFVNLVVYSVTIIKILTISIFIGALFDVKRKLSRWLLRRMAGTA